MGLIDVAENNITKVFLLCLESLCFLLSAENLNPGIGLVERRDIADDYIDWVVHS